MSNRPLKRRVTIFLSARDPGDPTALLKAVEEAFRPSDLVINVGPTVAGDAHDERADEQLETAAREDVAGALDRNDLAVRESGVKIPAEPSADAPASRSVRIAAFVVRMASEGWKITPSVLEIIAKLMS